MANMFSGNTTKTVPKTFDECIRIDAVSKNLWTWSERLERWGKFLFFILIIVGIIDTCVAAYKAQELLDIIYNNVSPIELAKSGIEIPSTFNVVVDGLWRWGIYAFLEYCAYHVLALLIGALASITQNTVISANIALFQANMNASTTVSSQPSNDSVATEKPTPPLDVKSTVIGDEWICGHCTTINSMNRSQCKKCRRCRSV